MTEELKPLPCPFCGSKMITHFGDYAVCNNCGAQGPSGEDQSHGTLTWNTRSPAWRDIESAPKNGDDVLLAMPDGHVITAYYRTFSCYKGWVEDASVGMVEDFYRAKPTHWMPLPLPPEEKA